MYAIICDACGQILKEKDAIKVYLDDGRRRAEVCKECQEKVNKINEENSIKENELHKQYDKLREEYKNKLKEIGIEL